MTEIPKIKKDRFTEVITSYTINRVCNYVNRKKYKEHITLITDLLKSVDEDYEDLFVDFFKRSCNEQILNATKKEIYAAMKLRYETPKEIARKLGISSYSFNNTYKDLENRDFITENWLKTEVDNADDEKIVEMCSVLNNFIDSFDYLAGEPYYKYYDNYRCIELEFCIIYEKLLNILNSVTVLEKFLFNLCRSLGIDWATISYMLRNLHHIKRSDDIQINGNKQLKQEIFNLAYLKGFNKGDVAEKVFNKPRSAYYPGSYNYMTKDITKDEWIFSMTFTPTIEWENINKDEVLRFIDVFRSFSNERL